VPTRTGSVAIEQHGISYRVVYVPYAEMTMSEHVFSPMDNRCIHCGTTKEHHERTPQPCPRRAEAPSSLRPEPAERKLAADDADTIHARLQELRAAREAGWNVEKTT
jgi:hypothetical protein